MFCIDYRDKLATQWEASSFPDSNRWAKPERHIFVKLPLDLHGLQLVMPW
jgi:hypothetical protein